MKENCQEDFWFYEKTVVDTVENKFYDHRQDFVTGQPTCNLENYANSTVSRVEFFEKFRRKFKDNDRS